MKIPEYLALTKEKLEITSDYALAKQLGISRGMISLMQSGKSGSGDETAVKIASILELPAGMVLADFHRERSKTDEVREAWQTVIQHFERSLPTLPEHM